MSTPIAIQPRNLFLMIALLILPACGLFPQGQVHDLPTQQYFSLQSDGENSLENSDEPMPVEEFEACGSDIQSAALRSDRISGWEAREVGTCYELTIDIASDNSTYTGSARIRFKNLTGETLPDMVLRLYPNADRIYGGELTITSALVNGERVELKPILTDGTALRLELNEPLQPEEMVVITLDYVGEIPFNFGDGNLTYGIFNFSTQDQVLALANWYPMLAPRWDGEWQATPVYGLGDAVVSEAALYAVRVTAPLDWQVVTSGVNTSKASLTESHQYEFVSGPVRDFVLLASPNFSLLQCERDGIELRHWGLPGGEKRWDEALRAAEDSLGLFEDRFGPYPYKELDIVATPLQLASGVEYPGLFLIGKDLYQPDQERPFLLGVVVAHEVAHQWWYAVVGNDAVLEPWQDEGLATYSSLLYQEVYQPRYYAGTVEYYKQRVADVESSSQNSMVGQPVGVFLDDPAAYAPIAYQKGAMFFIELRDQLGEEVFFKALESYYSDNPFSIVPPQVLLDSFENACECQLDEMYSVWGVP